MIVVIASGRQDDQATKADYAIKINSQAAARRHSVCQIQVTVRDQCSPSTPKDRISILTLPEIKKHRAGNP